jgi:uncharacterized coiled-coil DUF342 family protein
LKRQLLELLEKDEEFRLAVAGYLGLSETLKRLYSVEESIKESLEEVRALREDQRKLWEEVKSLRENQQKMWEGMNRLWENQSKMWEEVKALREGQNKLWENQQKMWEEIRSLREDQHKLWENQNRLWEEVRALREGQNKLWEEVRALREDQHKLWENQNRLWEEVRALREDQRKLWEEVREVRKDVRDVKAAMERITLSLEEEARGFIAHRLKQALGVEVELDRLFIDASEINVYGAAGDLCVVGEAAVRLGRGLVEELLRKVELLRVKRPDLLRRRLLKAIYTNVAAPEALQLAKERGVWVLRWDRDLTPMKVEEA